MIICIFLLLPSAFGQELVVMEQLGAVAEKCGELSNRHEPAHFTMIHRLSLLHRKMSYNNCTSNAIVQHEEQESKQSLSHSWMSQETVIEQTPV